MAFETSSLVRSLLCKSRIDLYLLTMSRAMSSFSIAARIKEVRDPLMAFFVSILIP